MTILKNRMTIVQATIFAALFYWGFMLSPTPADAVPVYPGDDIQEALNSNSSVELQAGDYYLSAPLDMPGDTTLSGTGSATVLHINSGMDPPQYGSAINFNGNAGGNFSTVRDLSIIGGGIGLNGQAHDNVVSGVEITDVIPPPTEDGHGIVASGGAGPSYNNQILNNKIYNVHHGIGISIDGASHHNVVKGNYVGNADMAGIDAESFWTPPMEAPHDNIIDGNTVEDSIIAVAAAFNTNRALRNQVTNNIVRRPVWWLYPQRVLGGHFTSEDDWGVCLQMAGIVAVNVGDMEITGNMIESALLVDIFVGDCTDVNIADNIRVWGNSYLPPRVVGRCRDDDDDDTDDDSDDDADDDSGGGGGGGGGCGCGF